MERSTDTWGVRNRDPVGKAVACLFVSLLRNGIGHSSERMYAIKGLKYTPKSYESIMKPLCEDFQINDKIRR